MDTTILLRFFSLKVFTKITAGYFQKLSFGDEIKWTAVFRIVENLPLRLLRILIRPKNRCAKSVQIRSIFWSVFSYIRTKYRLILRISPVQSECGKIRTRKYSVFGHFSHNEFDYLRPKGRLLYTIDGVCNVPRVDIYFDWHYSLTFLSR